MISESTTYYGVDAADALERFLGKKEILEKLLERFYSLYENSYEKLLNLYAEKKEDEIRKFIHELKGVAGNISAVGLAAAASELEAKIVNREEIKSSDEFRKIKSEIEMIMKNKKETNIKKN